MSNTAGYVLNCMDDDSSSSSSVVFVGRSDARRGLEWGDRDEVFAAPGTLFPDFFGVAFDEEASVDFSGP